MAIESPQKQLKTHLLYPLAPSPAPSTPADTTLTRLHRVLQIAMGWQDSHMHEFRVDDRTVVRRDWVRRRWGQRTTDYGYWGAFASSFCVNVRPSNGSTPRAGNNDAVTRSATA